MDCSLPGSSLHGIFQARVLEWVAISFSRGSSQPRDWTWVSCIPGRCFNLWATREVPYITYTCIYIYRPQVAKTRLDMTEQLNWTGLKIAKVILRRKDKTVGIIFLAFRQYCKATVIKTVWHCDRNRHTNQYIETMPSQSLNCVWLFMTSRTVACHAPLSVEFFFSKNTGVCCHFLL